MRVRTGLTLIELLTVLAIIAVLSAILFPSFLRARQSARETQCVSNLYQLVRGPADLSCPIKVWNGGSYELFPTPEPDEQFQDNVVIFCVQHLAWDREMIEVPLKGMFIVGRASGATEKINAKRVKRLRYDSSGWHEMAENGTIPTWPEIWLFPGSQLPKVKKGTPRRVSGSIAP